LYGIFTKKVPSENCELDVAKHFLELNNLYNNIADFVNINFDKNKES